MTFSLICKNLFSISFWIFLVFARLGCGLLSFRVCAAFAMALLHVSLACFSCRRRAETTTNGFWRVSPHTFRVPVSRLGIPLGVWPKDE